MAGPTRTRVRAPELKGAGGWIGTDRPLTLQALRGKVVLLDFWTFCCVNCLHVLDELRELEREFAGELVVIGVHSPKFAHEADHDALVQAVQRYEVHHPVLDDPELRTWREYAVRAWPTLAVVDPEGYLVAVASGEGHGPGLADLVRELVAEHEAKGTLVRGAPPYTPAPRPETELLFPSKLVATPYGVLVADTGHHRLVLIDPATGQVIRAYGGQDRGRRDGPDARFAEPQGVCLLPDGRAVVADTANHLLRLLDLATGEVSTVAGTGEQLRGAPRGGDARTTALSSPWDVAWWQGRVAVAMAGVHQLWSWDQATGTVAPIAGDGTEGLKDGPAGEAWLAQPSGLSVGPAGDLWFADAETSALRRLTPDGEVRTAVGQGLFDFGHVDGPAEQALLQHPLGVLGLPDGSVLVCDTYNNALRRWRDGSVTTVARGVREPSGAALVGGDVWVAESAAHGVGPVAADNAERQHGAAQRTQRPVTDVRAGAVALDVVFEPAAGQHLDERDGPATRLVVSASPPELLAAGAGATRELSRALTLAAGEGVLHVTAYAATCDAEGEHPACRLTTQDWGIPVRVHADAGSSRLALVLRGLDAPG